MANWQPKGKATGIGSLPSKNPEEAFKIITGHLPDYPHWPQLPQGEVREGFVEQSAYPLLDFGLLRVEAQPGENERLVFTVNEPGWTEKQVEFYNWFLEAEEGNLSALEKFAFPRDGVRGFYHFIEQIRREPGSAELLKGQVSGPVTVGFCLQDPERRASYYDPQLRDLTVKAVQMQAKWQTRVLKELALPVLVSIDDPGIYACGMSTHITLSKRMIQEDLNIIIETIHAEGGLAGVHICAGCDWSIVLETAIDVLFFDAYEYFPSLAPYTEVLKAFLERGGVIGWGIIPTLGQISTETVDTLKQRLLGYIDSLVKRGLPRERLINQALITPSCGTGLLEPDTAGQIYAWMAEISAWWRGL